MTAYYNEHDRKAAAWLSELGKADLIPAGTIDTRDIQEVQPDDVRGFSECHFFAGIGGWPLALHLAGWPSTRPVWTGSCPCQPFSSAGKRKGHKDERDLWPDFFRLITECRPSVVFGEQVASADVVGTELEAAFLVAVQAGDYARANKLAKRLVASLSFHFHKRWLSRIRTSLEAEGYALRWKILGAHSAGSPHLRQRLFWVAYRGINGRKQGTFESSRTQFDPSGCSDPGRLGLPFGEGPQGRGASLRGEPDDRGSREQACETGDAGGLEHAQGDGRGERGTESERGSIAARREPGGLGDTNGERFEKRSERDILSPRRIETSHRPDALRSGFWDAFEVIPCRDGKARRVPRCAEPGVLGMADGLSPELAAVWAEISGCHPLAQGKVSGRVGLLRGFGNAIVPEVAAAFIRAFLETE